MKKASGSAWTERQTHMSPEVCSSQPNTLQCLSDAFLQWTWVSCLTALLGLQRQFSASLQGQNGSWLEVRVVLISSAPLLPCLALRSRFRQAGQAVPRAVWVTSHPLCALLPSPALPAPRSCPRWAEDAAFPSCPGCKGQQGLQRANQPSEPKGHSRAGLCARHRETGQERNERW